MRLDVDEDDIDDFSNTKMTINEDIDVDFNLQNQDSNRASGSPNRNLAGIDDEAVTEYDLCYSVLGYSNSYLKGLSESVFKTQEHL